MFKDPIAAKRFAELTLRYHWQSIVETGTYYAESALIFSYYVPFVFTMDINPECFRVSATEVLNKGYVLVGRTETAMLLAKQGKFINLYCADSAKWLSQYLGAVQEPVCFYLDAHWEDYWPILDELKAIQGKKNCAVIIHDFQVPGKDFGYDTYKGVSLNIDLVQENLMAINPGFEICYNEEAAGNYRGILYALPEI